VEDENMLHKAHRKTQEFCDALKPSAAEAEVLAR
jgi:hypothetical protein